MVVLVMLLFSKPTLANGRPLSSSSSPSPSQKNTHHQEPVPARLGSVSVDATSVSKSTKDLSDDHQVSASAQVFPMASGPSRKGSGH